MCVPAEVLIKMEPKTEQKIEKKKWNARVQYIRRFLNSPIKALFLVRA